MSKYQVTLGAAVNFAPQTTVEEILQNVRTILSTTIGSVPLYRTFGVSWDLLDMPTPVSLALMKTIVIDAINRFEPRAQVESIRYEESTVELMEGLLKPIVVISIDEEYEQEETVTSSRVSTTSPTADSGSTLSLSNVAKQASAAIAAASSANSAIKDISDRLKEIEETDYDAILEGSES